MGQKVNPIGMRLGIVKTHDSVWYAERAEYRDKLLADIKLRKMLMEKLSDASVSRILIERLAHALVVTVYSSRPGIVIGKKGEDIDKLRAELERFINRPGQPPQPITLNVAAIEKPDLDAKLVADNIAAQLKKRMPFRRVVKRSLQHSMRSGAEGIRIQVSGRLGGAEIARTEWVREGRVPLHTLRADIDYATSKAKMTYGTIGVKVWIFRGEIIERSERDWLKPQVIVSGAEAGTASDSEAAVDVVAGEVDAAAMVTAGAPDTGTQDAVDTVSPDLAVESVKSPAEALTEALDKPSGEQN